VSEAAHKAAGKTPAPAPAARQAGPSAASAAHPALALQRMAGNQAVGDLLADGGRPLAPPLRQSFEARFGADFSAVRIHDAPRDADAVSELAAKAVTVGAHIGFSTGRFAPDTRDGQNLLAHELSHVVQQSRGGTTPPTLDGSGALEAAATQAADAAVGGDGAVGGAVAVAGASAPGPAAEPDPAKKPPSDTDPWASAAEPSASLTDEQVVAMSEQNPIRVEGKADHRYDDVLSAANRGLINLDKPAEFERQMRFRIAQGSTEFSDSWSEAERFDYAENPDTQGDTRDAKWDQYLQQRYMAYLADKAAQWEDATTRMDRAARVGNAIGKYTLYGIGAMFAAPALVELGPVELGKRFIIGKVLAAQTSSGGDEGMGRIVDFGGSMVPSANTPLSALGASSAAGGELNAASNLPTTEPPIAEPPLVEPAPVNPPAPNAAAEVEGAEAGLGAKPPAEPPSSGAAGPARESFFGRQVRKTVFTLKTAMAGAGDRGVAPALAGGENSPYLMRVGQDPVPGPPSFSGGSVSTAAPASAAADEAVVGQSGGGSVTAPAAQEPVTAPVAQESVAAPATQAPATQAPVAQEPTAAPADAQPQAQATVSPSQAAAPAAVQSVATTPPSPEAVRAQARKEKGEVTWAAMEQLGERFGMDAGVTTGDRIRLENRAATATTNYNKKMAEAGYQRNEQTGKWDPIPGQVNLKKAATAKRQRDRAVSEIADERNELQAEARKNLFDGETGPTTLDPENLDFGPASHETGTPVGAMKPDVHLPLTKPDIATRPSDGPAHEGLVARHGHQPNRGADLISEHVQPGAQYAYITTLPSQASAQDENQSISAENGEERRSIYDENQYNYDKTILVKKPVADFKTHEGRYSDNKRTQAIKDKAARGEHIDIIQDIFLPSLRQTYRAMDVVRRRAATPAPTGTPPAPEQTPPVQEQTPPPQELPPSPPPVAVPPASTSPQAAPTPDSVTTPHANTPVQTIPPAPRGTGPAVADQHSPVDQPHPQGTGGPVPGGADPPHATPTTPVQEPLENRPPLGDEHAPTPGSGEHGPAGGLIHGAVTAANEGAALIRGADAYDEARKHGAGVPGAALQAGRTYLEGTNIVAGAMAGYEARRKDGQDAGDAFLQTAGETIGGFVVPGNKLDQAINAGANMTDAVDDHMKRSDPSAAHQDKADIRDAADLAAGVTPSRMFSGLMGAGLRAYWDLAKAATGDTKGVDKFGDDAVKGKASMIVQPWAMAADFVGNLGSHEGAGKALDKTLNKAKGTTLEKAGSASGDAMYELGQSKEAKSGKYGGAVQGISMVLGATSDHIAGKSWEESFAKAAEPGKDSTLAKIGEAGGDLAWKAHETLAEVTDKDIPAMKQVVNQKLEKAKSNYGEFKQETKEKVQALEGQANEKLNALKSYLPSW
jgi:hypothetical protein